MTFAMINQEETCRCKSGLIFAQCCGRKSFPISVDNKEIESWLRQADHAKNTNDHDSMSTWYCKVLHEDPLNAKALQGLLAHTFNDNALTFKLEHFVKAYDQRFDNNVWAKLHLLAYELQRANYDTCYPIVKAIMRRTPDSAQGHVLAGRYFSERPYVDEVAAIYHFKKAKALGLDNPGVNALLAKVLMRYNQLEEAKDCYRLGMKRESNRNHSLLGLAKVAEFQSDFEQAWQCIEQMSHSESVRHDSLLLQAKLYRRQKHYDQALKCLEQCASENSQTISLASYWYERGRLHDKTKDYEQAMQAFQEANAIARRNTPGYNHSDVVSFHKKLKVFFKRDRLTHLPVLDKDLQATQPLFILGFPRSGTSLTEKILTAHSQVNAGGELPFIQDLSISAKDILKSELDYPGCLMDLALGNQQSVISSMQADYLAKSNLRNLQDPNKKYFTDKMPLNENHLGLINSVFPRSPKIHVIRHPLDVVLSNFFTELTHGNFQAQDIRTAAQHYALTMEMVFHYRNELDSNYYPLHYERLVDDVKNEVKDLLSFVGLSFEKECLDFYQDKNHTKTASYAQVTQPLYDSSKFRYKPYLQYLDPAIEVLEPIIEKLGYKI